MTYFIRTVMTVLFITLNIFPRTAYAEVTRVAAERCFTNALNDARSGVDLKTLIGRYIHIDSITATVAHHLGLDEYATLPQETKDRLKQIIVQYIEERNPLDGIDLSTVTVARGGKYAPKGNYFDLPILYSYEAGRDADGNPVMVTDRFSVFVINSPRCAFVDVVVSGVQLSTYIRSKWRD